MLFALILIFLLSPGAAAPEAPCLRSRSLSLCGIPVCTLPRRAPCGLELGLRAQPQQEDLPRLFRFSPTGTTTKVLFTGQTAAPQIRRQPAEVMDARGAAWLLRPEREEEERPDEVLDALKIRAGDVVADVGAGVGYFSLRLARRVGQTGRVLAVDIQQAMLDELVRYRDREGLHNIEPILGTATDPKLPVNELDLVLMVDVYHEFSHPAEMMERIRASLKPTGRVVFVEYRGEDPSVPIRPLHKMTERQVLEEIVPLGFRHLETLNFLPRQHIIIFEKQRN